MSRCFRINVEIRVKHLRFYTSTIFRNKEITASKSNTRPDVMRVRIE